jgi:hypothetical protein
VRVGLSKGDDRRRWYGFNALISTREGRRQDEALPEDEIKAASSSSIGSKCDTVRQRGYVGWRRGGTGEEK